MISKELLFAAKPYVKKIVPKRFHESLKRFYYRIIRENSIEFDFSRQPGRKSLNQKKYEAGKPLVSIVTPYYNSEKYFRQTFHSVMNQTFPWFEWIIVDDGSTEKQSRELLKELSRKDQRIRVVFQKNQGLSGARNTGIRQSRTEIIIPLDADDLITPTYVEQMYWALFFHQDASWAYSDSVGFGKHEYLWHREFSAERLKRENFLLCTAAIRKDVFRSVGGYKRIHGQFNEDWHFWLKAVAKGFYPVHIRGYLFWYRRCSEGMLHQISKNRSQRARNRKLIHTAAAKITSGVKAIEYPNEDTIEKKRMLEINKYENDGTSKTDIHETQSALETNISGKKNTPKVSTFQRKVSVSHKKIHILMLLPWMETSETDAHHLDICKKIDKKRFDIGIITTGQSENRWQQRFEEYVDDIFNLPDFLDVPDWAEFVSYYILSREVDVLWVSDSECGGELPIWIKNTFPELEVVDGAHMEDIDLFGGM